MLIDEKLVLAMKEGDESAFSSCYKLLSPFVYSVILRICGRTAIAEEIMQDSFIQAFTNLSQLRQNTHFTPWIKRIAFHKTVTYIGKVKNEVAIVDEHLDSINAEIFDDALMQQNHLAFLMGHLPNEAKLIIWLFVVEGYSHKEIAKLTNKSESYSKSLVSRNLAKLRNIEKGD